MTVQVTRDTVIELIERMPADKLVEVYDFARFITERPTVAAEPEPTEEELAAEDAKWDEAFARTTPEQWAKISERIRADIDAGRVLPMFDENGRWLVDDYTDEDFEKAAQAAQAAKSQ